MSIFVSKNNRPDRGQAQVEFLLSVLPVIVLIVWILQLLFLIYTHVVLAGAAKEGVRYAVVHGAGNASPTGPSSGTPPVCNSNVDAVANAVRRYINYPGMSIDVCYLDGTNAMNNRVQVRVQYPFIAPFLGWTGPTINAGAQGRIIY